MQEPGWGCSNLAGLGLIAVGIIGVLLDHYWGIALAGLGVLLVLWESRW